ncbi:MAG TPA: isoprenyl transferase [Armatimonadetes bacterium]|nr:isoprenyl transferase [Armatimonadota bacterium]
MTKEELLERYGLDPERMPKHVAIIMDGNGRWAQRRGLPRIAGHFEGVKSVRTAVETCGDLGIQYLTLYAFSTENWRRPKEEVEALMALIEENLRREASELHARGARVKVWGRKHELPPSLQEEIRRIEDLTKDNRRITLILAINYGGRAEIADAARRAAELCLAGRLRPDQINEEVLSALMYDPEVPEPDLLIRTGGEMRISNFLLWHVAYSEIYVTPTLWPDFGREELIEAIREYQRRERRFGGLG